MGPLWMSYECHCARCEPIRTSGVLTSFLAFSRQGCQQRQLSNWQGCRLCKGVLTHPNQGATVLESNKCYLPISSHIFQCLSISSNIPHISKHYYSLHTTASMNLNNCNWHDMTYLMSTYPPGVAMEKSGFPDCQNDPREAWLLLRSWKLVTDQHYESP